MTYRGYTLLLLASCITCMLVGVVIGDATKWCPACVEAEVVETPGDVAWLVPDPPIAASITTSRPCDNLFSMSADMAGIMDLECALVGDGTAKFLGVTYVPQDSYRLAMLSAEECGKRLEQCCPGGGGE